MNAGSWPWARSAAGPSPNTGATIAVRVLHRIDAAECAARGRSRLFGCHAATDVVSGERVEVGLHFLIEADLQLAPQEHRTNARPERTHHD